MANTPKTNTPKIKLSIDNILDLIPEAYRRDAERAIYDYGEEKYNSGYEYGYELGHQMGYEDGSEDS